MHTNMYDICNTEPSLSDSVSLSVSVFLPLFLPLFIVHVYMYVSISFVSPNYQWKEQIYTYMGYMLFIAPPVTNVPMKINNLIWCLQS